MKCQYEILRLGLTKQMTIVNKDYKDCTELNQDQINRINRKSKDCPFFTFSTRFCDNRANLMDLMKQMSQVADDEVRIKEEFFNLLSMFILTFEMRTHQIQRILYKNKERMIKKITEFKTKVQEIGDDEMVSVMDFLVNKLNKIMFNCTDVCNPLECKI